MSTLVDSSVLIHIERENDPKKKREFFTGRELAIATVSIAELLFGAFTPKINEERRRRARRLVTMTRRRARILPLDASVAETIAELWAKLDERKVTPSPFDLVIAATAVKHDLELLTSESIRADKKTTFTAVASVAPLKLRYFPS